MPINGRHNIHCILPPHILDRLSQSPNAKIRKLAIDAIENSAALRAQRMTLATLPAMSAIPSPSGKKTRLVYDVIAKQEEGEEISIRDLKAIFFLRDPADTVPAPGPAPNRRRLEVIFPDKERLEGSTEGYSKERQGFFMVPEDPVGKIIRCFVVNANVASVKWL